MLSSDYALQILSKQTGRNTAAEAGNSAVDRVCIDGRCFGVKRYLHPSDGATRYKNEWSALTFLETVKGGLAVTPVWGADEPPILITDWVDGEAPKLNPTTVIEMLGVLSDLKMLGTAGKKFGIGSATDSVLRAEDLSAQVNHRLERFSEVRDKEIARLCEGVAGRLRFLESASDHVDSRADTVMQTLSPSDFGPHNLVLASSDGRLRLVDLEFFGFDSPYKLAGDALLHPQNSWEPESLGLFLAGVEETFGLQLATLQRYLPRLCLKWALIVIGRTESGAESPETNLLRKSLLLERAHQFLEMSALGSVDDMLSAIVCQHHLGADILVRKTD